VNIWLGFAGKIPATYPNLPTNSTHTLYPQPCFKSNNNVAQTSYFVNNFPVHFAWFWYFISGYLGTFRTKRPPNRVRRAFILSGSLLSGSGAVPVRRAAGLFLEQLDKIVHILEAAFRGDLLDGLFRPLEQV
jgi:hypothetical protein